MTRRIKRWALLCGGLLGLALALPGSAQETYIPGQKSDKTYAGFAQHFVADYCVDCHNSKTKKGNLSLEDLGPLDETNADLWKSVWAQITLQEMPPKKTKVQPEIIERLQMSDWIVAELQKTMASKGGFRAHQDPGKGNFVSHDLLFGELPEGIKLVPTSSPARLWRLTPQEHITRLNELINTEPKFDPTKPGLRTRGDAVPTNHGGELKMYFGVDRITKWQGGTVAYATSVKSVPAILSSAKDHGLENYPHLYTVNSAEATQTLAVADDVLRYMAYGP
ncbi:MAG: c-type cytochrome domain-containing protein, partial [Planctomycetota bacterium]